jgi:hypothetical protein
MNLLTSLIAIFFLNSCNQVQEKSQSLLKNEDIIVSDKNKSISLDSLSIKYWKSTEANEYYFKYSDNIIQISSQYFSLNKNVSKEATVSKFLNYIDVFFIAKIQVVEVTRKRSEDSIVADYSVLTIQGYKDGKEIINRIIQIGEEEYNIEYNPKFIEFYEFLDGLVTEK